jgi:hypothetical protein
MAFQNKRGAKTLVTLAVLVMTIFSGAAFAAPPRVYFLDGETLAKLRADIDKPSEQEFRRRLIKMADRAMKVGPYSVTTKEQVPPSGDKHDYLSMAPYFWPNAKTPNKLPYLRRDGERNPEAAKVPDRDYIVDTFGATYTLSVAYYLTGEEKYAQRAALLLRTWFLDPATRMKPNMNHGQYIAGINTGRGAGLIETRTISKVVDSLGLLAGSKAWTAEDEQGMRKWLTAYFDWLQNSKNGRSEAKTPNNHGSWYEQQLAVVGLYLGENAFVKDLLENRTKQRIANQIDTEGKQKFELQRTKGLHYSSFNLLALTHLQRIGDVAGVDLWNYSTPDGRSVRKGLDWLLPYVSGEKKWEYQQISEFEFDVIEPVLLWSAIRFGDERYETIVARLASPPKDVDELILLTALNGRTQEKQH